MEKVKPFTSAGLLWTGIIKIKLKVPGKAGCAGEPRWEHKDPGLGLGFSAGFGAGLCSPALAGLCQL